jgi:hypothetical protein
MSRIVEVAHAERQAKRSLDEAAAAWRSAWWRTTFALAEPTTPETAQQVLAAAGHVLGHSTRYLGQRRQLGIRLGRYPLTDIEDLPPRHAMVYIVSAKADPARIREVLTDAQARELSIRDFARELGAQPASWQREDERRLALVPAPAGSGSGANAPGTGSRHPAPPRLPGARKEVNAVMAALDMLTEAVSAFAAVSGTAAPGQAAALAARAAEALPGVQWLASLGSENLPGEAEEFLRQAVR